MQKYYLPIVCTGKITASDRQMMISQLTGVKLKVKCPKCRKMVYAYVTPLGDGQLERHYPDHRLANTLSRAPRAMTTTDTLRLRHYTFTCGYSDCKKSFGSILRTLDIVEDSASPRLCLYCNRSTLLKPSQGHHEMAHK